MKACDPAAAPPLGAVLDDDAVLLLGLDGHSPLDHVVAERLLHVDVLAGLGGQDRHQRVPVVGGGDRDRVDRLVVEQPAEVLLALRGQGLVARLLGERGERAIEHLLVGVADGGDLDAGDAAEPVEVGVAPAVAAEDGDPNAVVGPGDGPGGAGARDQERPSGR